MSFAPALPSLADLSAWFYRQVSGRAHQEIDYAGDAVPVAVALVRLAASAQGGLLLLRGRPLQDRADRLIALVREIEAEICPGAVARAEEARPLLPVVIVEVRPGALGGADVVPPELRPALGYAIDDLDPEGVRALCASTQARPGADWPATAAGRERALFGLGLARTFGGALVPTVAGLLAVGGPDGTPPVCLTVAWQRPGEAPYTRRAWLYTHLDRAGDETGFWGGLSDDIAAWAIARALTTRALSGPRARLPIEVRRGRTKVALYIPRDPAAGREQQNPHLRGLVERLGLLAAPLGLEGGEALLAERGLPGPIELGDAGGVWLKIHHTRGPVVPPTVVAPRPPPPVPATPPTPPTPPEPRPRRVPPRARYVPAREREAAVLDLLQTAPAPMSTREIAERLGWEPHRVAAVIYPLADTGRVLRTNPERRASNQRYALAPGAEQAPTEPAPEAAQ